MSATRVAITASQTVGPFFHDGLLRPDAQRHSLLTPETAGERIRVEGRVIDGEGRGVPDALIEIWQADASGRHAVGTTSGFLGFGRSGTDADGRYWFETIRPGAERYDDTRWQAPHISVAIFGRGLLNHLFTRVYFADDPALADDPILSMVAAHRRTTLIAERVARAEAVEYRFDIVLQGAGETVFFDFGAAAR